MKKMFYIATALALSISITGCSPTAQNNTNPQGTKMIAQGAGSANLSTNQQMTKLLPYRENFQWLYQGFAEYGHKMQLKYIEKTPSEIRYSVDGEVADMSGGEAKGNFKLKITYIISNGTITQYKTEEKMLDSKFDNIQLAKGPLVKNTAWVQQTFDRKGKAYTLDCKITDIVSEKGQNIYTVYYKDKKSAYYEKRKIKEGIGVIWFEKLFETGEGSFPVTYSLNLTGTGYLDKISMNSYLPPLGKTLRYFGLAEYAHTGTMKMISSSSESAVYQFNGSYADGSGIPGTFKVQYLFDYLRGTVTEKVIENTRQKVKLVNSKMQNPIILKFPIQTGNTWYSNITINGKQNQMEAKIVDISFKGKTYYSPYITGHDKLNPVATVRYVVRNVPGYYKNIYIEERKFQIGRGMIGFGNLMQGNLPISAKDMENPYKLEEAFINHMFGYSLAVNEI